MAVQVPYRTVSELEHMALDLLKKYGTWKGKPARPPIDVDDIVEGYFGLDLEVGDLRTLLGVSDVLGATWFDEKLMRVDSSLEGKEGRLAFTLGHEIGHWWVHRPIFEMEKVTLPLFPSEEDRKASPAVVCRSAQRKEPAEWQADMFAALLLMPGFEVRAAVKRLYGDVLPGWEGIERRKKAGELDPNLRDLSSRVIKEGCFTNVSNEAMRYRLLDLRLVVDQTAPQRSMRF